MHTSAMWCTRFLNLAAYTVKTKIFVTFHEMELELQMAVLIADADIHKALKADKQHSSFSTQ